MHQCRDCSSMIEAPQAVLCDSCRAAATERRRAFRRDRGRALYHSSSRVRGPNKPSPPHPCATKGCVHMAEGKAVFCPACRRARHLRHQKNYRDNVRPMNVDLPPEPPTNLKWLDKFSDWAKSGMSYAEYQKTGMAKRG